MTNLILIVGKPMSGKSSSASTWEKPILFFDFDGNSSSIFNLKNSKGELVAGEVDKIEVINCIPKVSNSILNFKTILKGNTIPSYAPAAVEVINRVGIILNEVISGQRKCNTIIFDSITAMFSLWKDMILVNNSQPSLQQQDYGTLSHILFKQFLPMLRNLPTKYVILIDHTEIVKDEKTNIVEEFPIAPSKPMGRIFAKEFMNVWLQLRGVGGATKWMTEPYGFFEYAGSRTGIPNGIEANFKNVEPYFKSTRKEEVPPVVINK